MHDIARVVSEWNGRRYITIRIHKRDCEACQQGYPVAEDGAWNIVPCWERTHA